MDSGMSGLDPDNLGAQARDIQLRIQLDQTVGPVIECTGMFEGRQMINTELLLTLTGVA